MVFVAYKYTVKYENQGARLMNGQGHSISIYNQLILDFFCVYIHYIDSTQNLLFLRESKYLLPELTLSNFPSFSPS